MLRASNATPGFMTLTVDGRLSLDKISNVDEGLARAAREGLTWTVINKDVSEVGEVLSLLQASQNSVSAILAQSTSSKS